MFRCRYVAGIEALRELLGKWKCASERTNEMSTTTIKRDTKRCVCGLNQFVNAAETCKRCKKPYEKGAVIWWKRDKGCRHEACGSWAPDPPQAEATTRSASS